MTRPLPRGPTAGTPAADVPADFRPRVVDAIAGLAPGEVVSYGDLAVQAGFPGAARGVGAILAHSDGLPWWRVVTATGRLVPGHEEEQTLRLRAEGVEVSGGRVVTRRPARLRGWTSTR